MHEADDEKLKRRRQEDEFLAAVWKHTRAQCPSRFDVFMQSYGPDPREAVAHYYWNASVCAALLPTLTHAEVLLRNSIHRVMASKYGDWWFDGAIDFLPGEQNAIERAKFGAARNERKRGKRLDQNDIIVELNFRFWTNLLLSDYSRTVWNPLLVGGAFPHLPSSETEKRKLARFVFSDACDIRNRVCHGERVVHLPNLAQRQDSIMKAIGWISQPTERIVKRLSRFPETWGNGLNECRLTLLEMVPNSGDLA